MATLVANGNRSVISPAYADADDGYFEHASSQVDTGTSRFIGKGYSSNTGRQVYGPGTVWRNGVAYPNSRWAAMEVVPIEDPYHKGRWIHPDRANIVKNYNSKKVLSGQREPDISDGPSNAGYVNNKAGLDSKRSSYNNVSSAVSGALNKVTGIPGAAGNALKNSQYGQAAQSAMSEYDKRHSQRTYTRDENGNMVYTGTKSTGNIAGRALAGAKGAVGQEARNIYEGAIEARNQYRINNYNNGKKGNIAGEALATASGAIGSSAVGRAGKAAFEALKNKAIAARDSFTSALNKYLTGDNAKTNRSQALQDLQTKGGQMMSAIRNAFGTDEGRASTLGKLTGTASGIAAGIAQSNVGQAAISAGKAVYNAAGAAKERIGSALSSIGEFFKKKSYKAAAYAQ